MKKLISFGIGIALLASPVLASAQTTSANNASIIATLEQLVTTLTSELESLIAARGSSPAAQNNSGMQTYTNAQYGFSIQYPTTLTPITNQSSMNTETYFGSTIVSGFTPIVQFQMNGRSNTDSDYFLNATAQISVATSPQAVAACQNTVSSPSAEGDVEVDGSHTQSTTYISSVPFNEVDGSDDLTGNGIGLRALSVVHNGICYRIDIITSGDYIDVSPTVDQQTALGDAAKNGLPFNAYDAYTQMNSIVQSFQFTNSAASGGSNQASAAIDQSSLVSNSGSPTITGTAQGMNSVTVVVSEIMSNPDASGPVWGKTIPVQNGTWSFTPSPSNGLIGGAVPLSPGLYRVRVSTPDYKDMTLVTGTFTVNAPGQKNSSLSACTTFSYLQKGDTDGATGGEVSQLQQFLGMSNVTGYYGAQTAIAYQNKCGNLGNAQPSSVPGMSQYTDPNFGFSFWYPSGWSVTQTGVDGWTNNWFRGGTVLAELKVGDANLSTGVTIYEFTSPNDTVTELGSSDSASPVGVDQTYYFDSNAGMWMYDNLTATPAGGRPAGTITPADTSNNTMGGLHIFSGAMRFGDDSIVPLSASNFVVVSDNSTGSEMHQPLEQTIVATNPAVAIPVSTSQQIAIIGAEETAYANQ